jgi:hypothetical protein
MSRENVEIARRLYPGPIDVAATLADREALATVRAAFEPLVHPDFETVIDLRYQMMLGDPGMDAPPGSPSISYGIDGFVSIFREWLSAWETRVVTPTDFIDVDENRVLVMLDIRARSKTHQVEMPVEGANLLRIKEGRVARIELFFERNQALEAAGLRD